MMHVLHKSKCFVNCPLQSKFVQIFQIGPKRTISFQGLASFWNNDRFFASKKGYESKKNYTKTGITQVLIELQL